MKHKRVKVTLVLEVYAGTSLPDLQDNAERVLGALFPSGEFSSDCIPTEMLDIKVSKLPQA